MPQQQSKGFTGYGVVYPDPSKGSRGLKVIHTFTRGSTRIHHPDGSVSHTVPPPVIHELYGGGFCYQSGKPVDKRKDLEEIDSPDMKERALKWFDESRQVTVDENAPTYDPNKKAEPQPDYIISSEVPLETLETGQMVQQPTYQRKIEEPNEVGDLLRSISSNIGNLVNTVNTQAKAMVDLTKTVKAQGQEIENIKMTPTMRMAHKKQGETMREKWKDPEYRAKMSEKMRRGKNEARRHEAPEEGDEGSNGGTSTSDR
jgi:hypothetical protein